MEGSISLAGTVILVLFGLYSFYRAEKRTAELNTARERIYQLEKDKAHYIHLIDNQAQCIYKISNIESFLGNAHELKRDLALLSAASLDLAVAIETNKK